MRSNSKITNPESDFIVKCIGHKNSLNLNYITSLLYALLIRLIEDIFFLLHTRVYKKGSLVCRRRVAVLSSPSGLICLFRLYVCRFLGNGTTPELPPLAHTPNFICVHDSRAGGRGEKKGNMSPTLAIVNRTYVQVKFDQDPRRRLIPTGQNNIAVRDGMSSVYWVITLVRSTTRAVHTCPSTSLYIIYKFICERTYICVCVCAGGGNISYDIPIASWHKRRYLDAGVASLPSDALYWLQSSVRDASDRHLPRSTLPSFFFYFFFHHVQIRDGCGG